MKSKDSKSKDLKSKETKDGKHWTSTSGRKSSKQGEVSNGDVAQAPIDDDIVDMANDIAESGTKPDTMSDSKSGGSFAFKGNAAIRLQIVQRSGATQVSTKILNKGNADFLKASDKFEFDMAVLRVWLFVSLKFSLKACFQISPSTPFDLFFYSSYLFFFDASS